MFFFHQISKRPLASRKIQDDTCILEACWQVLTERPHNKPDATRRSWSIPNIQAKEIRPPAVCLRGFFTLENDCQASSCLTTDDVVSDCCHSSCICRSWSWEWSFSSCLAGNVQGIHTTNYSTIMEIEKLPWYVAESYLLALVVAYLLWSRRKKGRLFTLLSI